MAHIEDLTVSGQQADSSIVDTPPDIGLNPIVRWTYVNDAAAPGQVSFTARIGTTQTDWGTVDFVGDIVSETVVNSGNYFEYTAHDLVRGENYYGQIRSTDVDGDVTAWINFYFRINRLPAVTSAKITPTSPQTSDDLELEYLYSDADGHDQSGTKIRWFKNGKYSHLYDDLCIVPSSALSSNDSWYAKITPSDGLEFGEPVITQSVTISALDSLQSGLPVIQNVKILPLKANIDDILKVEYDLAETEYLAIEDKVTIAWYINDTLIGDSNQQFIRPTMIPGDEIYVQVTLRDSSNDSQLAQNQSGIKTILDVPWYVYHLEASGQREHHNLPELTPVVTWLVHKTAVKNDKPLYLRVIVNKTETLLGAIYDSGSIEYKSNHFQIPKDILKRGQSYYIHVGAGDSVDIDDKCYDICKLRISGSSWESNVDNSRGWTIETKLRLVVGSESSPFTNPYIFAEQPDEFAAFQSALESWNENISILADEIMGSPITSSTGIQTATAGGFVIRRIYPIPVSYDGDFNDNASNPYSDTGLSTAWSACLNAYNTMRIKSRRKELDSKTSTDIHVHDGAYYCSISMTPSTITFLSENFVTYSVPSNMLDLTYDHIFRIEGQNTNLYIYLDNVKVLTILDQFNSPTGLKRLEIGQFSINSDSSVHIDFFRYTTDGVKGTDNTLSESDNFFFKELVKFDGGSVDFITQDRIVWTPYATSESSKTFSWRPNAVPNHLQTVNRSFSPITSIFIDNKRNKYIGTANGVTAIYGEKHDPDYKFDTTINTTVTQDNFDRISNVPSDKLTVVEQQRIPGWFSIDTTYRSVGDVLNILEDPYDVYSGVNKIQSQAIHYYSQRTHGHSWFDKVDNTSGWQIAFSLIIEKLEADDLLGTDIDHHGFGLYINDGSYQEVIYFYEDRLRLYHANVYVPIVTTRQRDYVISGKNNNIYIYQKLRSAPIGSYQLLADGSGLFTKPAVKTGNSRKPRIVYGSDGYYHSVWHDDSKGRSQILYSKFNQSWSQPEIVVESSKFDLRNPDLDVDGNGRVWVAYEDTSWGPTEISVSVKDSVGWNPKIRVTNSPSKKNKPAIKVDTFDNVHVVWEDDRNGHFEIFWAWWQSSVQAWNSSAQFGEDMPVAQYDTSDPYQTGGMEFRNPKLALLYPYLYMVYECHFTDTNYSSIFYGYRNLDDNLWISSGVPQYNQNGDFIGAGTSTLVSDSNRNCFNPSIATGSPTEVGYIAIVWEDQSEPIKQIWGRVFFSNGNPLNDTTEITNAADDAKHPSIGLADQHFVILHEKNNRIYANMFNTSNLQFIGSGTGYSDQSIPVDSDFNVSYPVMPPHVPTKDFIAVYEFLRERDASDLNVVEYPDYSLIGDVSADHDGNITFTVSNYETVSSLDTKEFAFGDLSENVGMQASWKDISLYFGYDARPYSISNFNTKTVKTWPDNRINDLFVDVYGNIIAATFGGLIYHNVLNGQSVNIPDFKDKKVNSVKWTGGKWHWYVGSDDGLYRSNDAGRSWVNISTTHVVSIDNNKNGYVICGFVNGSIGVYKNNDDTYVSTITSPLITSLKTVAIDENNIVWVGRSNGLYRIENFNSQSITKFDVTSGMRSSYVYDIEIVTKQLRYIATTTGMERMHGYTFTNLSVHTHDLLNNNVYRIKYLAETNSLWVGAMHQLHEIVFRDPAHEIIADETVKYNALELLTDDLVERNVYYILDKPSDIQSSPDAAKVFINKNKVSFGYTVDGSSDFITFACDLLTNDEVEIETSNLYVPIHDFNQLDIEEKILGFKRTAIKKILATSSGRDFYLSSELLMDGGLASLPFTTILLDVDKPTGCLERLDTISRSQIRFRIIANDLYSGVESYMLSNYENFTSDGETPLAWKSIADSTIHDLGESMNNVIASITFPDTAVLSGVTYNIGDGSHVGIWIDGLIQNLITVTDKPLAVYKYNPAELDWDLLQVINDSKRYVTSMRTIGTALYMTTATTETGGRGDLRRMIDLSGFTILVQVNDQIASGIADADNEIFFGAGNGDIYSFNTTTSIGRVKFESIGESITALDVYLRTLLVATSKERESGIQGQLYSVNLDTSDVLPEYVKSGTTFSDILIFNKSGQPADALAYISGTGLTEIYQSNMADFSFTKSYASFNKSIARLQEIPQTYFDSTDTTGDSVAVVAVGDILLKKATASWEFVYHHDETITDFITFESLGINDIWIVSKSKISRWTQVTEEAKKTVYLRLKDKAGNISDLPTLTTCPQPQDPTQPVSDDNPLVGCCMAYAIKIKDLQDFINESRIVDVTSAGNIIYTLDSPTGNPVFSADRIDEEIGTYVSEIFNGSPDLVAWKSISWVSTSPTGTSVNVQIRSGQSEEAVGKAKWSDNLIPNEAGVVPLEYITNQYIQFRVILRSTVRGISPSLTSVTLRSITGQASHFFTTNFVMPSRPVKGILTSNTFVPVSADIIFGMTTKNSTDFADYQIIEPNRLFTSSYGQFQPNLRIGARLLSPSLPVNVSDSDDPYDTGSFSCNIIFDYKNTDTASHDYHFRIRFYNDPNRTQLIHTFFTGNDQTGWQIDTGSDNIFPATGISIAPDIIKTIVFAPLTMVETNQRWYLIIDAFDGTDFETVGNDKSFVCSNCNIVNELGLVAEYYQTGLPTLDSIPSFSKFTPDHVLIESEIDFVPRIGEWVSSDDTVLSGYAENFGARFRGRIQAVSSGIYTLYLSSSDGARLFIDGNTDAVIDNDGIHSETEKSGSVILSEGFHDIEIHYFQSTGTNSLKLKWVTPGSSTATIVPGNKLFHGVFSEYCDLTDTPRILSFAVLFELENGEMLKINLN